MVGIENVDKRAADVGVETGESLFELVFIKKFVVVRIELVELVADKSGREFRD